MIPIKVKMLRQKGKGGCAQAEFVGVMVLSILEEGESLNRRDRDSKVHSFVLLLQEFGLAEAL